MKKLYLAYGSNLNLSQMKYRCPNAKIYKSGQLYGYALKFKGSERNAYATIEQEPGETVPVLIWEIDENDEKSLDRYEGWPLSYYKENIKIELEGKDEMAMAYIMNPNRTVGIPSSKYIRTITEGYKALGFPLEFLDEALERNLNEYIKQAK